MVDYVVKLVVSMIEVLLVLNYSMCSAKRVDLLIMGLATCEMLNLMWLYLCP